MERVLTDGPGGRILTNVNVWSPDSQWIVFDTRSDAAGSQFDGTRIQMVHARTSEIRTLYESKHSAHCGVATWHPKEMKVAFILGPEHPTTEWSYGPSRRQGVIVDADRPGNAVNLDARDLVPPFTAGALRGGSHVHVFHPDGDRVSFTYEDEVLRPADPKTSNCRNVGISVPAGVVKVGRGHSRNHDGTWFTVLATQCTATPRPGSDDISRACEESWIGSSNSLAFQGNVLTAKGTITAEVYVADLPKDVRVPGDGPLQGTPTRQPCPPKGTVQRRLTFTADRKYAGLQGPRHWLRSAPDGSLIGCLMKDDAGIVQFCTVTPKDGSLKQLTRSIGGVASAFTWSHRGEWIAAVVDGRVSRIDARTGAVTPMSPPTAADDEIRPEACAASPDGRSIAYVRRRNGSNQICVISTE